MRLCLTLGVSGLLATFAAGAAHAQAGGYDASYHEQSVWTGEWPNGFAVARRGIVVMGQERPDPRVTPTISCELPFKATFHPWNTTRNLRSGIEFKSFQKIVRMRASKSFTTQSEAGRRIAVKKGQSVEFLMDGAEGEFTARFEGQTFLADSENFDTSNQSTPAPDEWVKVKCMDDRYAWIFVNELNPRDEGGTTTYRDGLWAADGGSVAVPDFGKARDLSDADVKRGKPHK